MLEGPRRIRPADAQRHVGAFGAHEVGDEPVLAKVAAADDVPSPRGGGARNWSPKEADHDATAISQAALDAE